MRTSGAHLRYFRPTHGGFFEKDRENHRGTSSRRFRELLQASQKETELAKVRRKGHHSRIHSSIFLGKNRLWCRREGGESRVRVRTYRRASYHRDHESYVITAHLVRRSIGISHHGVGVQRDGGGHDDA